VELLDSTIRWVFEDELSILKGLTTGCFGPKIDRTRLQFKNCNFEHGKTQIHLSRQAGDLQGSIK